jgi:hypothetical protein
MKRAIGSRVVSRLREKKGERAPSLRAPRITYEEETRKPPPIFIIGAQRSGTSLLRRILDSHSQIACPAESKFILPLTSVLSDRGSLAGWASMGFNKDAVEEALARFIRSFFDEYAESQGKPRWAEKTPNYVDCLPELWDLFGPDARFVIVVRHGLDVAFSLSDPHRHYPAVDPYLIQAGGVTPVAAGLFWADKNRKICEFQESHPDACFRLRYEDLTTDPVSTLKPLFAFLDEPWEPEAIEYGRHRHHRGFEDPDVKRHSRIRPNSNKHLAWPQDLQRSVREACGPLLGHFGYR